MPNNHSINIEENNMLKIILYALLIFDVLGGPNCPVPYQQQSAIFSDSVKFTAQDNGNLTSAQKLIYNYKFSQPINQQPNLAIGLNQIVARQSPTLQIIVSSPRISQEGIYFKAQSNSQSHWKNFKINFVASSRDDIQIGSVSSVNPVLNAHNTFQLPYNIKGNFQQAGLKTKSFLQSISLHSENNQKIGIKEQRSTFHGKNKLYITFSNIQRVSMIRMLTISVIVFNTNTIGILYADGVIDQNYVVSLTQLTIPKHGINELRTYIVGINSFLTSSKDQISISSSIQETFELVIGPINRNQIDFISVSYLILSIIDCGSCSGYPLLFDGICNQQCPTGTLRKKGKCIPIQCFQGYILGRQGQCIEQCGQNSYYDYQTQRCLCQNGYYIINNACRTCLDGFKYNFRKKECQPICSINSYYNPQDKICYCNPGYFIIDRMCQKCPYGTTYQFSTQSCQQICGQNQIYTPQGCQCKNNYYPINGKCARCPYKQIWSPILNQCTCPSGYELFYNQCILQCKQYEQRINGNCQCIQGYQYINGKCGKCPQNSIYDSLSQKCQCIYDYKLIQGKCIKVCPKDYFLDSVSNKCMPYCQQRAQIFTNGHCICHKDYERRPKDGICIPKCRHNQYRGSDGTCKCNNGFWRNAYGQCRPINCPKGTSWNQYIQDCVSICRGNQVFINGRCVCQMGFIPKGIDGLCLKQCSWYEEMNKYGVCECISGYKKNSFGYCELQCANGSYQKNGICVCQRNCGYNHNYCKHGQKYDQLFNRCICNYPKVWVLGKCINQQNCKQNQYWSGNSCQCISGYYKIEGICRPVSPNPKCPSNSFFNGISCKCFDGYFPVGQDKCQKCPIGYFYNGYKCEGDTHIRCKVGFYFDENEKMCKKLEHRCKQNQQWNGNNCRCKQGYFWINHSCQKCQYGEFYDGIKCTKGEGQQCHDPYSFWNGQKCVCIPGYHPFSTDKCINCPDGSYWNGHCCQAKYGYSLPKIVY